MHYSEMFCGGHKALTSVSVNLVKVNKPSHDKTNKIACLPSKDPDQPGHLPSLISLCCALKFSEMG